MAVLSIASASVAAGLAASASSRLRETTSPRQVARFPATASVARRSDFTGATLQTSHAVAGRASTARSAVTVCKVSVGDAAPSFTLSDQSGRPVSLSKFKGKPVVVYFYPADETPGCTKQACAFRDAYTDFRKAGAEVVGISGDSPESHQKFAEKYNLPYTLLADEGNQVRKEWGVPSDFLGLLPGRQTYVIDKKGVVQLVFNNQFAPEKHIPEALRIIEAQKESSGGGGLFSFLSK